MERIFGKRPWISRQEELSKENKKELSEEKDTDEESKESTQITEENNPNNE